MRARVDVTAAPTIGAQRFHLGCRYAPNGRSDTGAVMPVDPKEALAAFRAVQARFDRLRATREGASLQVLRRLRRGRDLGVMTPSGVCDRAVVRAKADRWRYASC